MTDASLHRPWTWRRGALAAAVAAVMAANPLVGLVPGAEATQVDAPANLTVTVDNEGDDGAPESSYCEDLVPGDCSLREALQQAQANESGGTRILFAAGVGTIAVDTDLPAVPGAATIDGLFSGRPAVQLTAAAASEGADDGLFLDGDGITVRGLEIFGFGFAGVEVSAGSDGDTISRSPIHDNGDSEDPTNILLDQFATSSESAAFRAASAGDGNNGQNSPDVYAPTTNTIPYTAPLSAAGSGPMRLEFFTCSGEAEGLSFVGTATNVTEGAAGVFSYPLGTYPAGTRFSATATDQGTGDTSEFSACTAPSQAAPATAIATCTPGTTCTVAPPPGTQERFQVTARNGTTNAVLTATLNGGSRPQCDLSAFNNGAFSANWLKFGFADPAAGATWEKEVTVTGVTPTDRAEARQILRETQICFAAPYVFVPRGGEQLFRTVGDDGMLEYQALIPDCNYLSRSPGEPIAPGVARPCITVRRTVQVGGGWVAQISYKVPAGDLDPKGASVRKKKKKRR